MIVCVCGQDAWWRLGGILWELDLLFCHVDPKGQRQVVRLCSKPPCLLSHLSGPILINFRSANGLNYWLGQRPHRHPEMCCGKLPPCLRGQPQESGLTITAGGGRKGLVGRKLAERIPPVSAGLHPLWGFGGDCRACITVAPSGQGGSWVFRAPVNSHPSSVTVLRRWVCHTDGQRAFVQRNEGSGGLACTKVTRRK